MPDSASHASQIVAALDVGTNTVKLLVARVNGNLPTPLIERSLPTRLGEGLRPGALKLREAAMRRTAEAISNLVAEARELGAAKFAAVGTEGLRQAENSDSLVQRVKKQCDLDIEIIEGDDEADLSYLAVRRDPHWSAVPHLVVIDVGGGSSEVVVGSSHVEKPQYRVSVPLGAVRLSELCFHANPPTVKQLAEANAAAAKAFAKVCKVYKTPRIVGVGGTFTNLGTMQIGRRDKLEDVHGVRITAAALDDRIAMLSGCTVAQRKQIPGLDPERADIILGGAIIVAHALAGLAMDAFDVSIRGLRWGVLYGRLLA